jgi:FkbM family methyltransferase
MRPSSQTRSPSENAASLCVPGLVFDVGMHKGEDAEFYLNRGFRVIGVEPNPELVQYLRSRFAVQLKNGQLQLVDKAIAEHPSKVTFAVDSALSVWGSISPTFIERNRRLGNHATLVEVDAVPLDDLIVSYGVPYYLKVDIEGMDMECVRALHRFAVRPHFISLESAVTSSIADSVACFDELAHLWALGYRHFKYVDQSTLHRLNGRLMDQEGETLRYEYRQDSSGPFGEESPGRWLSIDEALRRMKTLMVYQNTLGLGGRYHHTLASRIGRRLYRAVNGSHSWYDLHARLG